MTEVGINLVDRGGKGDGVTDNSPVFERIFASTSKPTKLILPEGTFLISRTIQPPVGWTIEGLGSSSIIITSNKRVPMIELTDRCSLSSLRINLPMNFLSHGVYLNPNKRQLTCWSINNIEVVGMYPYKGNGEDTGTGLHLESATGGNGVYYGVVDGLKIKESCRGIFVGSTCNANFFDGIVVENPLIGLEVLGSANSFNFVTQSYTYTDINVLIRGSHNEFNGMIYDLNSYGKNRGFVLTPESFENIIQDRTGTLSLGSNQGIEDLGRNNRITATLIEGVVPAGGSVGSALNPLTRQLNVRNPSMAGLQDNCLSHVQKWGSVKVQGTLVSDLWYPIENMFIPNMHETVFYNPKNSPITITIDVSKNPIYRANIFGIVFSDGMLATALKVDFMSPDYPDWINLMDTDKNTQATVLLSPNNIGATFSKLRVTITEASGAESGNSNSLISISHIFCTGAEPTTFLSAGGGTIWGNLKITGTTQLGSFASLPAANESLRGTLIIVEGKTGVEDKLYICKKMANNTFGWKLI